MFNRNINLQSFAQTKIKALKDRLNGSIISLNEVIDHINNTTKSDIHLKKIEKVKYFGEQFYFFLDYAQRNEIDPTDSKHSSSFDNIKKYCDEVDLFLKTNNIN